MTIQEPVWCAFCEDRPAIGRMVVMRDQTRDMIAEINGENGVACDLHGRAWTGVPVAAHDESGEVAVLQYVHPDFEKVTELHITDFASEKTCIECGDPTDPMPMWVAERILKAHPGLVLDMDYRYEGICGECAENTGCPHCDGRPDDGEDHDHYLH